MQICPVFTGPVTYKAWIENNTVGFNETTSNGIDKFQMSTALLCMYWFQNFANVTTSLVKI